MIVAWADVGGGGEEGGEGGRRGGLVAPTLSSSQIYKLLNASW